jgi:hypothetical protein
MPHVSHTGNKGYRFPAAVGVAKVAPVESLTLTALAGVGLEEPDLSLPHTAALVDAGRVRSTTPPVASTARRL